MGMRSTEVAVVGAGPYGLSLAAHLRAKGLGFRIFGSPMSFWLNMPRSLNLKSFAFATSIFVPEAHYTFPEYCLAHGLPDLEPCSMRSFAEYGLWVQRELVPEVETGDVAEIRRHGAGFEVVAEGGETFRAERVVVAVGLRYYARLPDTLAHLPRELVSHSSEHTDFSPFVGQDVAVIGAGASALESATILREEGARPVLLVREGEVVFHQQKFNPDRPLLERLRSPVSVLGPGQKSWLIEKLPMALHYVPEARRVRFTRRAYGPAGPWWLYDRFKGKVPVRKRCHVTRVEERGGRARMYLMEDGTRGTLDVDHIISGTGFEVDVDRLPFLHPNLRAEIRRVERSPALSRHFESSASGLYFVGTSSAFSFGPLFRFVAGAAYAAPVVARHAASARRRLFIFGLGERVPLASSLDRAP